MKAILFHIIFLLADFNGFSQQEYIKAAILLDYKKAGYLTDEYNHLIYKIATKYTTRTMLAGKVNINNTIEKDQLNFFILKKDPQKAFETLNCNCAYVGYQNTIVCDASLFDYLEKRLRLYNAEDSVNESHVNKRFFYFLCEWLIGHEIGHVILKHKIGLFHQSSVRSASHASDTTGLDTYFNREQEADLFSVRNLDVEDELNPYWFWLGLSNMISTTYNTLEEWNKYQQDNKYRPPSINLAINTVQHPPWLLRYLNMVNLLLKIYPDLLVDTTKYFDFIKKRIKLLKAVEIAGQPFCANSKVGNKKVNDYVVIKLTESDEDELDADKKPDYEWDYERGIEFFNMANFKEAGISLAKAISALSANKVLNPKKKRIFTSAYKHIGIIELLNKNYDSSISALNTATTYFRTADIFHLLAINFLETNDFDNAQVAVTYCLKLDQFNVTAWIDLALILQKKNDYKNVLEALKYAAVLDENALNASALKYQHYYSNSTWRNAQSLLTKFKNSLIGKSNTLLASRELYEFAIEYENQLAAGDNLVKIEDHETKLIRFITSKKKRTLEDSVVLSDLYNNVGIINATHKLNTASLKNYAKSRQIKEKLDGNKTPFLNFRKGETYYNIGNLYFTQGKFDSCLTYYNKAHFFYAIDTSKDAHITNRKNRLQHKLGLYYIGQDSLDKGLNYFLTELNNCLYAFAKNEDAGLNNFLQILQSDLNLLYNKSRKKEFTPEEKTAITKFQTAIENLILINFADQTGLTNKLDEWFKSILKIKP